MNIMMNAESLYSENQHPVNVGYDQTGQRALTPWPRSQARVKYYYVDFGISSYFPAGEANRLVTGLDGHDEDVPELSSDVPYDPFKVDVFIIGNLLRTLLLDVSNLFADTLPSHIFVVSNTLMWSLFVVSVKS